MLVGGNEGGVGEQRRVRLDLVVVGAHQGPALHGSRLAFDLERLELRLGQGLDLGGDRR